jgi:selenocysteine lyase/cysteine desulfurase
MNVSDMRKLVYGLDYQVPLKNGGNKVSINFDNAATTPILIPVLQDVMRFLTVYSSTHRGFGYKSKVSTEIYDNCRDVVGTFVNSNKEKNTVIFVKNTTEAINKLSNALYEKYKDAIILSTDMEHHSNDLPWRKFSLDYINIDLQGALLLKDLEDKLNYYGGKVKLITVTGVSNVTGYKNPIHKIASIAHKYNAMIMVDAAQLVSHAGVNMNGYAEDDYIDFLAFSGHKMYAPLGCGVLIGPKWLFEEVNPDYPGGGNVDIVTHDYIKWNESPLKNEPGSPNVVGAVALVSAMTTLAMIGMDNIEKYERKLTEYAIKRLCSLKNIKLYCCSSDIYRNVVDNKRDQWNKTNNNYNEYNESFIQCKHLGIIPFNIENYTHEQVAEFLSDKGAIAVRNGCFCAQPYVQKLLLLSQQEIAERIRDNSHEPGMVRVSFGFYNTFKEIDKLIYYLERLK